MKILVTNDDGIEAEGLWLLARALRDIAPVVVVAPEGEKSAIGTAVTLFESLQVNEFRAPVPGIAAYSVAGTPSDCVILALTRLVGGEVDVVVSGINHGANVGDDVLISGTVAAAMQGYYRGCHALAVSMVRPANGYMGNGARLAAQLVRWIDAGAVAENLFLNVNLPAFPLAEIAGAAVTRLASGTHTDTAEESGAGGSGQYRLFRRRLDDSADPDTDVAAVEQGCISLTPLHSELLSRTQPAIPEGLGPLMLRQIRNGGKP